MICQNLNNVLNGHSKFWGIVNDHILLQFLVREMSVSANQRTNGPLNAHLISWPSKAQNIQNLENIW